MAGSGPWVSASDLADYTFCPRSHWYRYHPPDAEPAAESVRRSEAGVRYHARALGGERARAEHAAAYALLILFGVAALAVGVAWVFHL